MSNNRLTRTCVACGIQKPLSAFLEISGAKGAMYGNICATCRGAGITGKPVPTEDEYSTSKSSSTIDAKARYQIDLERKRKLQEVKDLNLEEQKKRDTVSVEKSERSEIIKKAEKEHQEKFTRVKSIKEMLGKPSKPEATAARTASIFEEQRQIFEAEQHQTIGNKQEARKQQTELGEGPFVDTAHAFEQRLHAGGSLYREFQQRLGPESSFLRNQRLRLQKNIQTQAKDGAQKKDPTVEYVQDNMPRTPGSGMKK